MLTREIFCFPFVCGNTNPTFLNVPNSNFLVIGGLNGSIYRVKLGNEGFLF